MLSSPDHSNSFNCPTADPSPGEDAARDDNTGVVHRQVTSGAASLYSVISSRSMEPNVEKSDNRLFHRSLGNQMLSFPDHSNLSHWPIADPSLGRGRPLGMTTRGVVYKMGHLGVTLPHFVISSRPAEPDAEKSARRPALSFLYLEPVWRRKKGRA